MKGIANKLTPKLVREYHLDVLEHVDADLLTIEDVSGVIKGLETLENIAPGPVKVLLEMLEAFDIFDPVEFLKTTAVTVPIGQTYIYIPWVPGETKTFSLASQVEILSHEGEHVLRSNEDERWLKKYLLKFSKRCEEERKAFQVSFEVFYLLYGFVPEIKDMTGDLAPYFLRPTDEKVLWAGLEAVRAPTASGARATRMGKFAARWLNERIKQ